MSTGADTLKRINYLRVSMKRWKEKLSSKWLIGMGTDEDFKMARMRADTSMILWRKVVENKMFPCIAQQISGWKEDCGEQAMTVGFDQFGNMEDHKVVKQLIEDGVKPVYGKSDLDE